MTPARIAELRELEGRLREGIALSPNRAPRTCREAADAIASLLATVERQAAVIAGLVAAQDAAEAHAKDVNDRLAKFGSTTLICPSEQATRLNAAWAAARALDKGE